ncbi:hypothetical protein NMY22_g5757 [Coprinellus aureogranulatus]|nr:hypothetical protein NMY22_g5757 [Coprinellus aureogranulatus]
MHLKPFALAFLAFVAGVSSKTTARSTCDPKARGAGLEAKQRSAIHDLAQIMFVQQDVRKAFNTYIPGEYINHNPSAISGREWSLEFLEQMYETPDISVSSLTALAGEGYGILHYRLMAPSAGIDWAIMDRLRFEGTCFVEHWDVVQTIFGNETNPVAFF